VLDGEAVVLDLRAYSDFDALVSRWHDDEVQLYAFDLLALEGDFPPGVEDDRAKGAAYDFAKASGCVIHHQAHKLAVLFVKEA
jgi:hypothetical protein